MESIVTDSTKIKTGDVTTNDVGVVQIEHLSKAFGKKQILKDISLTIKKGESVAVLGKSGTGKTVLIKCLVGLIEPDKGSINVLGEDILTLNESKLNELRKKIGFLFQSAALYDSMTVRENLEFPLRRNAGKKSKTDNSSLVKEVLESVGLADAIDKMPSELSGGMRKRIGLARTLILKPEIILYDEPTTGLDPITSREISHLMLEVQKKYGTTSVFVTHDMECTKIAANRIVMVKEGVFAAEGTYNELEKSEDKWVKSFFEFEKNR